MPESILMSDESSSGGNRMCTEVTARVAGSEHHMAHESKSGLKGTLQYHLCRQQITAEQRRSGVHTSAGKQCRTTGRASVSRQAIRLLQLRYRPALRTRCCRRFTKPFCGCAALGYGLHLLKSGSATSSAAMHVPGKHVRSVVSVNVQHVTLPGRTLHGGHQACYKRSTCDRHAITCGAAGGCGDLQQHELVVAVLEQRPCIGTRSLTRLLNDDWAAVRSAAPFPCSKLRLCAARSNVIW